MECPSKKFLQLFAFDPDIALESSPGFSLHLATCSNCQSALDAIGKTQRSTEISQFFTEPSRAQNSLPQVDGFTILEFVAAGTSGTVYRAQQDRTGRLVALKIVFNLTNEQRERINTERRTLIKCDHPNIVQLIDCGQQQGGCYFATRWVSASLAQYVRDTPIVGLQSAVDWLIQLAGAVSHLHGLGIIHRDLKLSNVLLTSEGVPKLTDFGIAKELTTESTLTAPQTPLGTPGYMAPEQTGQSMDRVSVATDIYGLGAVLYHLITGRQPFIGSETRQVISQVLNDAPIAPRKLRPEIPKDLETICLKCLEKCPRDRYASSLELAEDLSRFRLGDPIKAKPLPRTTLLWRSVQKHKAVAGLMAMLLVTLTTATAYIWHSRRQYALQQEVLSRQALLDSIASASVDSLPTLYAEATSRIGEGLSATNLANSGAVERVRWLCIAPHSQQIQIPPNELINVVEGMSSKELAILLPKLAESYLAQSSDHKLAVDQSIEEDKKSDAILRLVCFRSSLDVHWSPTQTAIDRVLNELKEVPTDESILWAKLLDRVKAPLISSLLQSSDRFERLSSVSLRKVTWQWLNRDAKHLAELIKLIPIASIGEVRHLPQEFRQEAIKQLRGEFHDIQRRINPAVISKPISTKLQTLLNEGSGLMWATRGIVTSMRRDRVNELIAELAENQLSLLTIQPYEMGDQPLFCAVFESSNEPCEVDWSVPLDDMQLQMAERRSQNWEAVSTWIEVSTSPKSVSVLWRKGEWRPSRFFSDEIQSAQLPVKADDSDRTRSQIVHQYLQIGEEPGGFALQTGRICEPYRAPNSRFLDMNSNMLFDGFDLRTTHKLVFDVEEEEIMGLPIVESEEHRRQATELLAKDGYQPFYLFAESQTGRIGSYWNRRKHSKRFELESLAKIALASWALGDDEHVLHSLNTQEHPSVRTAIIENLPAIEMECTRIVKLLQPATSANQLQGLVISLASAPKASLGDRQLMLERLKWCWTHPDSGVHFAADHVIRQHFPKSSSPIINREYGQAFGYDPHDEQRMWFYSPLGLPFVIVNHGNDVVYGIDEHLPWNITIDRHFDRADYRFAICAVEVPQDLVEQFITDTGSPASRHSFAIPQGGPAMGLSLELMLKFCRWLSDREGIPREHGGLPELADIKEGLQLSEGFWSKDGYRLPTNVEWETAFRGGTQSRHFLGNSFEYMPDYCWDSTNCEQSPKPIATRKPNPWGLFDIAGNLYEAVLGDHRNYSTLRSVIWGEKVLDKDTILDIRGGSFLSSRIYSTAGSHHHIGAWSRDINCGFRIARTLPEVDKPE